MKYRCGKCKDRTDESHFMEGELEMNPPICNLCLLLIDESLQETFRKENYEEIE